MQCEGRSVFRGTEIETFNVEILDVIDAGPDGLGPGDPLPGLRADGRRDGPRLRLLGLADLLPRRGRPAAERGRGARGRRGLRQRHRARDADRGDPRDAGGDAAAGARPPRAAERRAEPWSLPLTVSGRRPEPCAGRSGPAARRKRAAAARRPRDRGAGQHRRPTSSRARRLPAASRAGRRHQRDRHGRLPRRRPDLGVRAPARRRRRSARCSSGRVRPPGDRQPATRPGRRPRHLQAGLAGDTAGTVDFDGNFAISGTLGAMPATIPVEVARAAAPGSGSRLRATLVADESALELPDAASPALSLVTPIAVSDSAFDGARLGRRAAATARSACGSSMRERRKPMRFCNRYVGDGRVPRRHRSSRWAATRRSRPRSSRVRPRAARHRAHPRDAATCTRACASRASASVRGPRRVRPGQRDPRADPYQRPREPIAVEHVPDARPRGAWIPGAARSR